MTTAYATTDDVNNVMGPHQVTASTAFTLTQLTAVLLRLSARIDAILSSINVTVVPVVDNGSTPTGILLGHLKTIVSWGGAAIAFKALFPEATGPGESPAWAYWDKRWTDAVQRLAAVKDIPHELLGSTYRASSYFTESPDQELLAGRDIGLLAGSSLFSVDDLDQVPW